MSETKTALADMLARPAIVGLMSYLGSKIIHGSSGKDQSVGVFGMDLSLDAFYGGLGFVSSMVTETAKKYILPLIPGNSQYAKAEIALLAPAIHGGLNVAMLSIMFPSIANLNGKIKPLLIGAGAEFAGDYAYMNFVRSLIK